MKNSKEFSWINFKLDRKAHAKLSFILKCKQLHLKDVMANLIDEYVDENQGLLESLTYIQKIDEKL